MTLRRIYSAEPLRAGGRAILQGDAANHVLRVLRLRQGDRLVVFDGSGRDFDAEIAALGRDAVTVTLGEGRERQSESPLAVALVQGVCRGPRMDTVIQKATELGVSSIQPVLTERSVVRVDEAGGERKRAHWQRVAVAAAEQCGRSRIPVISEPAPLDSVLPASAGCRILLDPDGMSLREATLTGATVTLLVGPEGGLSAAEREAAVGRGYQSVRLGPRTLRTETAPVAALALLQFLAGDLG